MKHKTTFLWILLLATPVLIGAMEFLKEEREVEYVVATAEGPLVQVSEKAKQVGGAAKEVAREAGFARELFSESLIKDAINRASSDKNKIYHILTPDTKKHAWHKVCMDYKNWEPVKNIITKVMLEGELVQSGPKLFDKILSTRK